MDFDSLYSVMEDCLKDLVRLKSMNSPMDSPLLQELSSKMTFTAEVVLHLASFSAKRAGQHLVEKVTKLQHERLSK